LHNEKGSERIAHAETVDPGRLASMPTFTPEQWQEISPYLDHVLSLGEDEREGWLRSFRLEKPKLAEALQQLLEEHRALADEHFLERAPVRVARGLSLLDQKIGAYSLISLIGQGGMGTVWLAERSDGRFERQVALKFLSCPLTHVIGAERFKREGKILGQLTHPNIAELMDAGVAPTGEPYLVLEYVHGLPLDRYCDQQMLDVDARIRIFLDVANAVAHAHANLIVHRDIKPSNVLVRSDGQVKLLDFGIAKLLAEGANPTATVITVEGRGAMTPQFAAPEQITGENITTATDVYALGVLLYLLLTGKHPAGQKLHSTVELVKAIVECEPAHPSNIASSTESKQLAETRATTPEKLSRQLRGDLDTIVCKALKKNPAERYPSVTALADDLQRFLRHEPISARPDTIGYRTAKFLRRNRTVVTLAATAAVLVIGSLSAGLYVANSERKIAERRFSEVRQLANKFIELDNKIRGLPGSTQVRMGMVSDSLQYLSSLSSEAPVDKDLALEIAYAYVRVAHAQGDPTSPNLGQFAEAEVSLNRASGFVDPVLAKDPRNPRALFIATTVAHDRMVLADSRGDRTAELKDAADAASLVERFMDTHPVKVSDLYSMRYFYTNVAAVYDDAREFDRAISYSQRALGIAIPGSRANELRGVILSYLSEAQWQSGDLNAALQTAGESVELGKAEAAEGHASLRINLAHAYYLEGEILGRQDAEPSMGRPREALADLQKASDIAEDLASKDAADYLGRHNVAVFGLEMGNILRHHDAPRALAVYDHALTRIREAKTSSSTQRDEAALLVGSSYVLRWLGRENESKQRLDRAFELLQAAGRYPTDKIEPMSETYDAARAQADDYADTGQVAKAIEAYRQLLDKIMAWGPNVQNDLRDATCVSRTWIALAILLRRSGQTEEAGRLETQRTDLWSHWNGQPLNAQVLLRQSLSQITSRIPVPRAPGH
jgi:serine/threonine protein kinase